MLIDRSWRRVSDEELGLIVGGTVTGGLETTTSTSSGARDALVRPGDNPPIPLRQE